MTISISFDTEPLSKKIGEMLFKIAHFKRVDIGFGLSEFQTKDMHRHRPFTMRSRAKGKAVTKVRQHSLAEMLRSVGIQRVITGVRKGGGWKIRRRKLKIRPRRHWSTRPILREEMIVAMHQRLTTSFYDKIKW